MRNSIYQLDRYYLLSSKHRRGIDDETCKKGEFETY